VGCFEGGNEQRVKNILKKVWKEKKSSYLCNPNGNDGTAASNRDGRPEENKIIEKTEGKYKKQVPRYNKIDRER